MKTGIDIVQNSRLKRDSKVVLHWLTSAEFAQYQTFSNKHRQQEFLAGRWAAKEAVFKCQSAKVPMRQIEILNDEFGKPYVTNNELKNIVVSLSHEKKYTIAVAINNLEDEINE